MLGVTSNILVYPEISIEFHEYDISGYGIGSGYQIVSEIARQYPEEQIQKPGKP
jgi:hypothetical protein